MDGQVVIISAPSGSGKSMWLAELITKELMYDWYGLKAGVGYSSLNSRTQFNVLEDMINTDPLCDYHN